MWMLVLLFQDCHWLLYEVLQSVNKFLGLKVYDITAQHQLVPLTTALQELHWYNANIVTLRVKIPCDGSAAPEKFDKVLGKMQKVCEDDGSRDLTLLNILNISGKGVLVQWGPNWTSLNLPGEPELGWVTALYSEVPCSWVCGPCTVRSMPRGRAGWSIYNLP